MFIGTLVFIYRAQINTRRFDTLDSNINFYVSILFFAIIVGLRWDVGIDYMAYYDLVVGNNQFETELTRLELIPRGMIIFFRNFNIPFYFWFILMAYIQLFFIL